MSNAIKRSLRKSWHTARQHVGASPRRANRLVVEKVMWSGDALAPVMLSIDDLTNAWHVRPGRQRWEDGGDWGGALDAPGSALRFLEDRLLHDFPEVRTTFFTVAGQISAYTRHQPFAFAAAMDSSEDACRFFARLDRDPRFELAYHGFNHGTPGTSTAADFVQEFRGFESVDAAVAQTRRGVEVFARATGRAPRGGKYGGWDYNAFGDTAIDRCGFLWWCRDWMPRDTRGDIADEYYEPQWFGDNLVVALPTTVHGHFWTRREVDRLLAKRQIISIEEHISPIRPDGMIQTPNIVDDIEELRGLYAYLRGKNVWHATGTEVATYVIARERTLIFDVTTDGFSIRYDGRAERPSLTLRIDCSAICDADTPSIRLTLPDGAELDNRHVRPGDAHHRHLVDIPVMNGRYGVRPSPP